MIFEDIYIRSKGEKICLSIFYKNEEFKNSKKEKPCIIFLPGTMANPFTYWDFLEEMVKYDICIIGINYVGHGKSSRKKKDYTISDLKENVVSTYKYVRDNLRKYGIEIVLFGHSQGGILASLLIGYELDISKYILGNLILSNQRGLKELVGLKNIPNIFIPILKFFVKIYGKIFKTKQIGFHDYIKIDEEGKKKEEENKEEFKDDPLRLDTYPMSMVTSLINVNTKNLLKYNDKDEVIVIVSSDDPIFPIELEKEAYHMLNVKKKKLVILDSPHHMIYTEHPEKTAKIVYENIWDENSIRKRKNKI